MCCTEQGCKSETTWTHDIIGGPSDVPSTAACAAARQSQPWTCKFSKTQSQGLPKCPSLADSKTNSLDCTSKIWLCCSATTWKISPGISGDVQTAHPPAIKQSHRHRILKHPVMGISESSSTTCPWWTFCSVVGDHVVWQTFSVNGSLPTI